MATTDKLQKLIDTKEAIKEAIINKGVSIADTDTFASYPDKISSIKSGGTSEAGSLDFGRIGYAYAPAFLQESMDESADLYNNFQPNYFPHKENIVYFPKVDIQQNKPITFEVVSNYSSSMSKFGVNYPNGIIFPDIDFKNNEIDCQCLFYSSTINNSSWQSIHLKNIKVSNAQSMFSYCDSLYDLTFDNVDFSDCINLSKMFYYKRAQTLDYGELFKNLKIGDGANLTEMFYNNESLTILDLSKVNNWLPNVMNGFVSGCSSLEEIDFSGVNFSVCTNFGNMFYNCKKLQKVSGIIDLIRDSNTLENFGLSSSSNSNVLTTIWLKNLCAYKYDSASTVYFSLYYMKWGTGDEESQQSFIYSINNMYDRVAAGYTKTMTCKFTDAQKALLTDDMIASLTSKGYTIA